MKANFKTLATLIIVSLFFVSVTAIAQGKKEEKQVKEVKEEKDSKVRHHKGDGEMKFLDLNDEQKTKIKKMKIAHKKELKKLKYAIQEKNAKLKALELEDNADLSAINKVIDEIGAIKVDQMKKRAAHKQEIRKMLNEEQRMKFDMREERRHKNEGKHGKRKMGNKMFIKKFDGGCQGEGNFENRVIEKDVIIETD